MDKKTRTICIYDVYNRHNSEWETHTDWKKRDGKRYFMQMEIKKKKHWVAILIWQNRLWNEGYIVRDKEGHYIIIYLTRGYNPYKHLCTQVGALNI